MKDYFNNISSNFADFLPQLVAAFGILIVGLLVAWLVSKGVRSLLNRTQLDNKLAAKLSEDSDEPGSQPIKIEAIAGSITFWVIALFSVVGFFSVLDMPLVAQPLDGFLSKLFEFLPNLLSAGLLLVFAWLIAKLVRFAIRRASQAADLDSKLGKHVHPEQRPVSLTTTVANAAYWIVLLLFLPVVLDALGIKSITTPINEMLSRVMQAIPHMFAAALVIGLAYVLGRVVSGVLTSLLTGLGFDNLFGELTGGSTNNATLSVESTPSTTVAVKQRTPSSIVGTLALVSIVLFGVIEGFNVLEFDKLATLATSLTVLLGQILLAIIILGFGLFAGRFVANLIRSSGMDRSDVLAKAAQVAIIVLTAAMALRESGLAGDLVLNIFTLLVAAFAVAAAIAFGIGGRDVAKRYLERWSGQAESALPSKNQRPPSID